MSCRLLDLKLSPIGMACALCVIAAGTLHAADPASGRRSIQFTEPKNNKVSTNVNELRGPAKGLKDLEADLARPLKTFTLQPESSLDGVTARPIRPSRPLSTRQRTRMQNERDWAFSTPEEIMGTSPEDILNLTEPDENPERQNQSTFERFYERMYGNRSATNRVGRSAGQWADWSAKTNASGLGGDMQRALKQLMDAAPAPALFTPNIAPSSFGDMFKFNADRTPTPESIRVLKEQQDRIQSFKKIWSPPPSTPARLPGSSGTPAWSSAGNNSSARPFDSFSGFNSSVSGVPAPPPVIAPAPPAKPAPRRQEFTMPRRPF